MAFMAITKGLGPSFYILFGFRKGLKVFFGSTIVSPNYILLTWAWGLGSRI